MRQVLVILAVVALVGCGKKDLPKPQAKTPETLKAGVNETTTPKTKPKKEVKNPEPTKVAPAKLITNPIIEKEIRGVLRKPSGELTKADLEKLTKLEWLDLSDKKLTKLPERGWRSSLS